MLVHASNLFLNFFNHLRVLVLKSKMRSTHGKGICPVKHSLVRLCPIFWESRSRNWQQRDLRHLIQVEALEGLQVLAASVTGKLTVSLVIAFWASTCSWAEVASCRLPLPGVPEPALNC